MTMAKRAAEDFWADNPKRTREEICAYVKRGYLTGPVPLLHPLDKATMEDDISTKLDELDLRGAIIQVISSPAGLSVAFDDLMVYRLEDKTYAVDCQEWQHVWKTAHEAADDFAAAREARELGFDFETAGKGGRAEAQKLGGAEAQKPGAK
jgi:hypothetical protein